MKEKLIELSHKILLNSERIKILSEFILDKQGQTSEILVPTYYINKTAENIAYQISDIEETILNNI